MVINGVDLDGLAAQTGTLPTRAVVPGRVVHVDGDFLAYHCSYEKDDEPKTPGEILHNVETSLNTLMGAAGASKAQIYLTPKDSDKGNRYNIALCKEYQGNRQDKPKPRYLHVTRESMRVTMGAIMCKDHEADDGMSAAQYAAIAAGKRDLSIIATKDKDLRMVPGLHLEWKTGNINEADSFGWVMAEDSKMLGYGSLFFWAQVLMGDSVDNIGGLPLVYAPVLNRIDPTAASKKALETLQRDPTNQKALDMMETRKPKPCGPAMAEKILKAATSDKVAFEIAKKLYEMHEVRGEGFNNWRTGEKIGWKQALLSEMKLLWMRRTPNDENDVINWLKEVTL